MGKLRLVVLLTLVGYMSVLSQEIMRENNDIKTLGQLTANNLAVLAADSMQNYQVDTIKKKQIILSGLVTDIFTQKLLYDESLRNTSAFREESQIYKNIASVGGNIVSSSGEALSVIINSDLLGKANMIVRLGSLVADAVELGKTFASIVANGNVKNPLKNKEDPSTKGDSDGYNLLDRHQRLKMANTIYSKLCNINGTIQTIIYWGKFGNVRDLYRQINFDSYVKVIRGENLMNDIISEWKTLKK